MLSHGPYILFIFILLWLCWKDWKSLQQSISNEKNIFSNDYKGTFRSCAIQIKRRKKGFSSMKQITWHKKWAKSSMWRYNEKDFFIYCSSFYLFCFLNISMNEMERNETQDDQWNTENWTWSWEKILHFQWNFYNILDEFDPWH